MKKILTYLFVIISLKFCLFAQAPDTSWIKIFGGNSFDAGYCVKQTIDGGYIVAGVASIPSDVDLWLIKTDGDGNEMWNKTFGDEDGQIGYSVQQTIDSGYIVAGVTVSSLGEADIWLLKTNEYGDSLWSKSFNYLGDETGYSVQQTSDSGYIIVGETIFNEGYNRGVWLIKTDENGDTLWTKTFGEGGQAVGRSVKQTLDGGYIITGYIHTAVANDLWLIKTDGDGNEMWNKTFGDENGQTGYSVEQTVDSGYIVVGYINSMGSQDVGLIKTDENGDTLWTKTFGGNGVDVGYCVNQTLGGGYILTGYISISKMVIDLLLIKTDADGNEIWNKTIGNEYIQIGNSVEQTVDRGYIVVGQTYPYGSGYPDVLLIKLKSDSPSTIKTYNNSKPLSFKVSQNFPNPFNPSTIIKYQIPAQRFVTIKVYDVLGNEIVVLVNEEKPIGSYEIEFNAASLPSGVYFYQLQSPDFIETKKMILMK